MQVSATDADIRSNAEITYTLFGPGAEKFKLNPDTGELKTSAPLIARSKQLTIFSSRPPMEGEGSAKLALCLH